MYKTNVLLRVLFISVLISMPINAKKKSWSSKAFSMALEYGVDKAKEDLDKGENSKIIQYYKTMRQNSIVKNNSNVVDSTVVENQNIIFRSDSSAIGLVVKYPKSVKAGERFILKVKMSNMLKNAKMGGVTLSFPQYSNIQGTVEMQKFDSVTGYSPPQKMYSGILKKNIKINYFVMEGWENKWKVGTTRYMNLSLIAPSDTNSLDINIRSILIFGRGKSKIEFTNPTNANTSNVDQQGYFVKKIKISILQQDRIDHLEQNGLYVKNTEEGIAEVVVSQANEQCSINLRYEEGFIEEIIDTNCKKITNSKGIEIFCTRNKKVCKTTSEVIKVLYNHINQPR